jgi:hypothetical protein
MKMQKTHTEWIRLVATPEDKETLRVLTDLRNNDGFSETVRQLIREEGRRHNIMPANNPTALPLPIVDLQAGS